MTFRRRDFCESAAAIRDGYGRIARFISHHEAADSLKARVGALRLGFELLRQDSGEVTVQLRTHLRLVKVKRKCGAPICAAIKPFRPATVASSKRRYTT